MDWLGVAVLFVVAVGAACQVLAGVGFALVCSPLLVLALGHDSGVRVVVAMSIVLNVVVLVRSRRLVRVGDAVRLLIPAAAFVVPTVILAQAVRAPLLSALTGVAILLATALVASGRDLRWLSGRKGAVIAGAASGIFNVLAAASGPPVAIYATQQRWTPQVTAATLQAFALPLNVITFLTLGTSTFAFAQLGWSVGGLIIGTGIALLMAGKMPARVVRVGTLVVAALGGVTLLSAGVTAAL